jgi:hypothetical protein
MQIDQILLINSCNLSLYTSEWLLMKCVSVCVFFVPPPLYCCWFLVYIAFNRPIWLIAIGWLPLGRIATLYRSWLSIPVAWTVVINLCFFPNRFLLFFDCVATNLTSIEHMFQLVSGPFYFWIVFKHLHLAASILSLPIAQFFIQFLSYTSNPSLLLAKFTIFHSIAYSVRVN